MKPLEYLFNVFYEDLSRQSESSDRRVAVFRRTVSTLTHSGPGRPKYEIPEEHLLYFKSLGFTWNAIADMLLVSRWTLRRRVIEYGITDLVGFSKISNDELDNLIRDYRNIHGLACGRSMILGHLNSIGIKVQQKRVTESLVRVDPDGCHMRWSLIIRREKYNVPAPNSLWHIDSHHSLIRWGFVLHGAIDGYSRLITFLQCSTNNKAETAVSLFEQALEIYGLPSRVRTDKGGENTLIWRKMIELRGEGRGSYIAASSVHNQRIERLWRDVWNYVCSQFYYIFQAMEAEG